MIIFWRLLLAHLLTDFTFQTDKIAEWKRKSIYGVIAHSSIFLILSLVLTWEYLGQTWWKFSGLVSIILLFILHFLEDQYRIWSIRKSNSQDNVLFFLWDQFIHIILMFLLSPSVDGKFVEEKYVFLLILVICVTHMTSILVYYLEQAVYGNESTAGRLRNKNYLIAERFAILMCLLLPGFWWASSAAVLLLLLLLNKKLKLEFTKLNIIAGYALVILAGVIGRMVIYR